MKLYTVMIPWIVRGLARPRRPRPIGTTSTKVDKIETETPNWKMKMKNEIEKEPK